MTSSSFMGVLAQNGSASRLVIGISGGVPLSFTLPSMAAWPLAGAAAAPGVAAAAAGAAAGAWASGADSLWQPAPSNIAQAKTAQAHRSRLSMCVVLTGTHRHVKGGVSPFHFAP